MGVHKIRRDLAVSGKLYLGSGADAGLRRSAAGTLQVLGSNDAAPGTITGAVVDAPTLSAPTFSGTALGTLDLAGGELRTGTIAAALTNANVGTGKPGRIVVGHNGATIQFGFVHNGSVFIFSSLAGTGAVSSAVGA